MKNSGSLGATAKTFLSLSSLASHWRVAAACVHKPWHPGMSHCTRIQPQASSDSSQKESLWPPVSPTKSQSRGHPTQFVEGRGRSGEEQAAPSSASPVVTGDISSLLVGEVTIVATVSSNNVPGSVLSTPHVLIPVIFTTSPYVRYYHCHHHYSHVTNDKLRFGEFRILKMSGPREAAVPHVQRIPSPLCFPILGN